MKPKELVDAGVCVSMAQARRLSAEMEFSEKCRQKVMKRVEENRPACSVKMTGDTGPA